MLNESEIKDQTTTPMKRKREDGSRESEGYNCREMMENQPALWAGQKPQIV